MKRNSDIAVPRIGRRAFLTSAGMAGAACLAPPLDAQGAQLPALARPAGPPGRVVEDEAYWQRVAAHYRTNPKIINLEAGYWGMMPIPVAEEYARQVERINTESSYYARRSFGPDLAAVRTRVAAFLGVAADEIAFTRSATESLQALIGGYNELTPGDQVLYADVDYPAMQFAFNWLVERRGARVVRIALPEAATRENVLAAYGAAFEKNPDVKLVLLTHVNNKSGLMIPMKEITAMARARGIDVIADVAHSIGQVDFSLNDSGVDFAGFNLHKWIGAPLGVGILFIRRSRLGQIDRMMADEAEPADSILSRVHTGTTNFAAFLSVPAALDFHDAVGRAHKAARLRYLRDRWVTAARALPHVEVLTPDEPGMSAAITSFRLRGRTTKEDNDRIVEELMTKHGIFTVRRSGLERGDCVRVTPSLYNRPADLDRLAAALRTLRM